ncbi:hypothetical protein ABZ477_09765 [Microbacterium sp. NPDC019599]|uniref:Vgb family protein n=1 Tax=Microbacterium sp. NPDC019599 TaxID=3154690 RepID=UPI0033EDCC12
MHARAVVATAVLAAVAWALPACAASPSAAPETPPAPTPRQEETPTWTSSVPLPDLETLPTRAIALTAHSAPAALVATRGAVWVQAHRASEITRIDAATGAITAVIDTGGHLGCGDLTDAAGSVWLTGCEITPGLVRIDPASSTVVETVDVDGLGPAERDGELWIGDWISGTVNVRSFGSSTPAAELTAVPVPGMLDTEGGVAVAAGALWTADKNGAIAYRIDPVDGSVVKAVPMPAEPDSGYLISHDDAVWYTDPAHGLFVRIDPDSGETRTLEVRTEQPSEYWGIAASTAPGDPGRLWVRSGDDEVWLVDTREDAVLRRIAVAAGAGGDVQQVGDTLWVSGFATDEVEMISLTG